MSRSRTRKKSPPSKKPPVPVAAAAPAPKRPPRPRWVPSAATQLIVGAISVVLTALFIFSNTNGDITIQGDDVWIITRQWHFSWNYPALAPGRAYLMAFYSFIF